MKKQGDWLRPSMSLSRILRRLDFIDEHVERQARRLPKLMLDIARYQVQWNRELGNLKAQVGERRTYVAKTFRLRAAKRGDKITEMMVKEAVEYDSQVRILDRQIIDKDSELSMIKQLFEICRVEKSLIESVTRMETAELSSLRGIVNEEKEQEIRKRLDSLSEKKWPGSSLKKRKEE